MNDKQFKEIRFNITLNLFISIIVAGVFFVVINMHIDKACH